MGIHSFKFLGFQGWTAYLRVGASFEFLDFQSQHLFELIQMEHPALSQSEHREGQIKHTHPKLGHTNITGVC